MHAPPQGEQGQMGGHTGKGRTEKPQAEIGNRTALPAPTPQLQPHSATCSTPALGTLSGRRPRHKAERASWRPGYSSSGPGASADPCCAGGWGRCLWSSPLAWKLPTGVMTLGPPCPPLELRGPGGSAGLVDDGLDGEVGFSSAHASSPCHRESLYPCSWAGTLGPSSAGGQVQR